MKNIQWFPGHMTRAMRDMEAKRDLCDGVICVLDARRALVKMRRVRFVGYARHDASFFR